jgi:hypothetical protein
VNLERVDLSLVLMIGDLASASSSLSAVVASPIVAPPEASVVLLALHPRGLYLRVSFAALLYGILGRLSRPRAPTRY